MACAIINFIAFQTYILTEIRSFTEATASDVMSESHYVNVSVLIKFSLKTSVFNLNYHKISIKSYVVDVY